MNKEMHATDYGNFMKWFERNYFYLYLSCNTYIKPPLEGEGLTVQKEGLDDEMYNSLVNIIQQYYRNE